jgi:hypothetical protein
MRILLAALLLVVVSTPGVHAAADKHRYHADFRFRLERDWDSRRSDGSERDDRLRARIRLRFGADFNLSERITLGFRARSGSAMSQQSPHITVVDFDRNDRGDADVMLDKWYLRGESAGGRRSGWIGRNAFPFWKQNELFWDDDVTLVGLAGDSRHEFGDGGALSVHAGWFALPVGMRDFSGSLAAAQLVYTASAGKADLTAAAGYFDIESDPDDPDAGTLLAGDGLRDYGILVGNFQAAWTGGGRPILLGADLMHNGSASEDADGHAVSVQYGGTKSKGDWLVGYWYARIERLAVVGSYAEDDWVRWGSATQTRGSDLEGHEFRVAWALDSRINLVARFCVVKSITTVEDGKRFRIDFNYKLK